MRFAGGSNERCGNPWGTGIIQCDKCYGHDKTNLELDEFPADELDELDIATVMLRNQGYSHLADSVALARKALTK